MLDFETLCLNTNLHRARYNFRKPQLDLQARYNFRKAQLDLQQARYNFRKTQLDLQQARYNFRKTQLDLQQARYNFRKTQLDLQRAAMLLWTSIPSHFLLQHSGITHELNVQCMILSESVLSH